MLLHCGAVCGGGVQEWTMLLAWLSAFSHFLWYHKQIGPFSCWFPGEWAFVCSRTLWVSPTNSPMRLRVSPGTATPTGFFIQRVWGFISLHWSPGLLCLCHSPVVPPGLPARKCGTAGSASCHLAVSPLHSVAHFCPSYGSGWMFLL